MKMLGEEDNGIEDGGVTSLAVCNGLTTQRASPLFSEDRGAVLPVLFVEGLPGLPAQFSGARRAMPSVYGEGQNRREDLS